MHFTENIETLRVNISDIDALKIRERELERGAQKVNISRIHSGLIEIEIHKRPCINVNPKRLN